MKNVKLGSLLLGMRVFFSELAAAAAAAAEGEFWTVTSPLDACPCTVRQSTRLLGHASFGHVVISSATRPLCSDTYSIVLQLFVNYLQRT